jgi:hypothetical protein
MTEIERIIKLFQELPEFRQAEAVTQLLRFLSFPAYDDLIEEMGWISHEAVDDMRSDVDYWRNQAEYFEARLVSIARILEKSGVVVG